MSDQPVTVEITMFDTAMMSVDIIASESMSVEIEAGSGGLNIEDTVIDITAGVEAVTLGAAADTGSISVDLVWGGIKGDRGDPGGVAVTRIAGEALGGHRVVVQDSGGVVRYASSNDPSHAGRVLGITCHAAGSGAEILVQTVDVMDEDSWSWTSGYPVFLGMNGLMTQDIDQTGIFVMVLGVAVSATSFLINKQIPIFR